MFNSACACATLQSVCVFIVELKCAACPFACSFVRFALTYLTEEQRVLEFIQIQKYIKAISSDCRNSEFSQCIRSVHSATQISSIDLPQFRTVFFFCVSYSVVRTTAIVAANEFIHLLSHTKTHAQSHKLFCGFNIDREVINTPLKKKRISVSFDFVALPPTFICAASRTDTFDWLRTLRNGTPNTHRPNRQTTRADEDNLHETTHRQIIFFFFYLFIVWWNIK